MGRLKGSKNKIQTGISYPRKCEQCDYWSNNPSMYHYHKKTHQEIPRGTLCENGCGNLARFINTRGLMLCLAKTHHCKTYIEQVSKKVTEQWNTPESSIRREAFSQSFKNRMCRPEIYKKISDTRRKKFGTYTPERAKEFRHYARFIRKRAQIWAKKMGYDIGRDTCHVDHILSINDAWKAGLSEEIVNHPVNLRILDSRMNSSKGSTSLITVDELIRKIKQYEKDK